MHVVPAKAKCDRQTDGLTDRQIEDKVIPIKTKNQNEKMNQNIVIIAIF